MSFYDDTLRGLKEAVEMKKRGLENANKLNYPIQEEWRKYVEWLVEECMPRIWEKSNEMEEAYNDVKSAEFNKVVDANKDVE